MDGPTLLKGDTGLQDFLEIVWFVIRFAAWFLLVGVMAWGAGLLVRWLNRR